MKFNIASVFGEFGQVLGVCPCCHELFYVSEARPYLVGKQPHSIVDDLRTAERRLDNAIEKLDQLENALRQVAAKAGLRTAKRILKKIDPVFSGAGYDPQDVKVICDPVEYVVFNGMARGRTREMVLLARPPHNKVGERIQNSIYRAITKGNIDFKSLRVTDDGKVVSQ